MPDRQKELELKEFQLKLRYAEKLESIVDGFRETWPNLAKTWEHSAAETFYRAIHSLCGSSATYGAAAIAKHAREAEQVVLAIIYAERTPSDEEIGQVDLLLRRVDRAVRQWVDGVNKEKASIDALHDPVEARTDILILEEDYIAIPLSDALRHHDCNVRRCASFDDIIAHLQNCESSVILADLGWLQEHAQEIQSALNPRTALIALSDRDDVIARLEAVRLGALRFLVKPVDISLLVAEVQRASFLVTDSGFRVLVVDDVETRAAEHKQVLEAADIGVHVISGTAQALKEMVEFAPDLVLVEAIAPEPSGPELAAMLKQDHRFANVPILFLSEDPAIENTLSTYDLAGEGYMRKPVDPNWMVASVMARVGKRHDLLKAEADLNNAATERRYRELALNEHAIVSITDAAGVITYVNKKFCQISGYSETELLGQDHSVINSGRHDEKFFEQMWETISAGNVWHGEICNVRKNRDYYWVASTIVPFLDDNGLPYQYISIRTDVTPIKALEQEISRHAELLDSLHAAMTDFMSAGRFLMVAQSLLEAIMKLTKSQYGVMAEVLYSDDQPQLRAHAIINQHQGESKIVMDSSGNESGLDLQEDTELLISVITKGESMVIGDLQYAQQGDRLPGGDSQLGKMIGVPIYYGSQLVGVYALARSDDNYTDNMISFLDAFNSSYGVMIHAKRIAEMEGEVNQYLEQARNHAESANRAKSEFLSSMSHELRTPLNVILGFAQLMLSDSETSQGNRESADEILRAGHHLLDLVNEILDLSRIEAGQLELSMEMVQVAPLITSCLSLIELLADKKQIDLELISCDLDDVQLVADATRLNQSLINLLSNAIKYTPERGRVRISCEIRDDSMVRINIEDSGPGVPDELVDELFTSFNRLGAENTSIEGTGIGLVITKRLIEAMGGEVGYRRSDLGGSGFWVELPRRTLPEVVEEDWSLGGSTEETVDDKEVESQRCYSLLYIEDNLANLNLVKQLIRRRENLAITTAQDPEEGLRLIDQDKPDAVLLDINLPVMNGFEVLEHIRQSGSFPDLPVIALSANAMPSDIQRGLDAGFVDYITKPIQIDQFFEVLDRVLQEIK